MGLRPIHLGSSKHRLPPPRTSGPDLTAPEGPSHVFLGCAIGPVMNGKSFEGRFEAGLC